MSQRPTLFPTVLLVLNHVLNYVAEARYSWCLGLVQTLAALYSFMIPFVFPYVVVDFVIDVNRRVVVAVVVAVVVGVVVAVGVAVGGFVGVNAVDPRRRCR